MRLAFLLLLNAAWLVASLGKAANASRLPEPSGPYGIGRIAYDWADNSRHDTLGSDPKRNRELMVYVWYPTERSAPEPHGVYIPGVKLIDDDPELRRREIDQSGAENWAQILSGAIYSHVVENAPLARSPERFPLVIFSHGVGGSNFRYTALLEAIVSHGYVVVAIQHPGIAGGVVFPDGRLAAPPHNRFPPGLTPEQLLQRMSDEARSWIEVGAADERFVLDRLIRKNAGAASSFALAGRLDLSSVAVMGHSAGGAIATRTCELDTRLQACIDLDGALEPTIALPEGVIQHPLLFLEVYHDPAHMPGTAEQKLAFLRMEKEQLGKCPRGSYDVLINSPAIMHDSFNDESILNARNTPQQAAQALHNLEILESYILAFLDKDLKHVPTQLLDSLAPRPEATIRHLGL